MKRRTLAALMLVPLAALACAEQGDQQQEETSAQMEQAADTAAETGQGMAANRIDLASKGESGVTGTATWSPEGDSVSITVSLEGVTQGEKYPAHVHQGTCQAGGGVAAPLSAVTGGSGGSGEATTTLARSSFESGTVYFVQAHLADGTPAACGDLPSDAGLAPASGGASGM